MRKSMGIWPFLMLLSVAVAAPTEAEKETCYSDVECPGVAFCGSNRTCVLCLQCPELKRHANSTVGCVKGSHHCGPCIEGYEERAGSCEVKAAEGLFAAAVVVIVCGVLMALTVTAFVVYLKRQGERQTTESNPEHHPMLSNVNRYQALKFAVLGSPNPQTEKERYKKTGVRADGASANYEIKMLALVFLRMLETRHEFQLASNMEAAGAFSDIVLRHRKDPDDQWGVSYVQLKHKQNKYKLISKPDLGIIGDFSLVKYCASYETMKSSEELLSFGNFVDHKIIIFTNAGISDSLVDVLESDPLLSTGGKAVSFKAGGEVYQGLCEWVDFKEALTKLHGQVEGKSGEEVGTRIKDALEGVKYSNKAATSWRKELLEFPTSVKLKDVLTKLAPVRDKATYSSFLAKLQVYTNQAHESQLNDKIKEQLAKVWASGDNLEADSMCHALQSQVKSWWQKDNVYFTQDSSLWLDLVKSQLETLSKSTIEGLTKTGAEFDSESLRVLHEAIPSDGIVNVRVDSRTEASSLRVHQALAKFRGRDLNVLHVNVQSFLERKDDILSPWNTRWCQVLVLECDKEIEQSEAERISGGILNILGNTGKLLVLIAPESHLMNVLLQGHQSYRFYKDSCKWGDFTNDTQERILETSLVKIQGSIQSLSELSNQDKKRLGKVADLEVISQLLTGLTCGKALPKEGDNFVNRRLKSKDGKPFAVNSVRDVKDRVVLVVAEAGMGKSTLMTHLANRAKTQDPKAWIVLIKLNDCSTYLAKMDKDKLNEDAARNFLEHFALNPGNKLEKFIFRCLEEILLIFLDGVDEVCPNYQQQVFMLLGFIKDFKFTQLWIASRPVSQGQLECKLGVKALHLDPLSNEEQTAFISKGDSDPKEFATLFSTLSDKDREMLGVPLIAAMFVEVYHSSQDKLVKNGKLDKMFLYENYILKRLREELNEKMGLKNLEGVYFQNLMDKRLEEILHTHSLAALRALFDDDEIRSLKFGNNLNYDENLATFLKEVTDGKEKTGIIEYVINGKPVFTHRSLTKYLVACWLKDNFKENKKFTWEITTRPDYNLISEMFANLLVSEKHLLHLAVLHRDLGETKRLLSQPCEVNALDKGGRTALHLAVLLSGTDRHEDFIAIVDTLIQHGAGVDIAETITGWTPLQNAEQLRAWKTLDVILKNGAKSNEAWPKPDTVLMLEAARDASVDVVRYLGEERGGDLQRRGPKGETMVHMAAEGGNVEVLEFLLPALALLPGHAADVDVRDNLGETPLHRAARANKSAVVELLLAKGANKEGRDKDGKTPLHLASLRGNEQVVALLLRHEAEVNATDNDGKTPLPRCSGVNNNN